MSTCTECKSEGVTCTLTWFRRLFFLPGTAQLTKDSVSHNLSFWSVCDRCPIATAGKPRDEHLSELFAKLASQD